MTTAATRRVQSRFQRDVGSARVRSGEAAGTGPNPTNGATADPLQLLRDVAQALARLPSHYREAILMRDLEGRSIAEMASELSLHPEATKARIHRARSLARQYLSPSDADGIPALAADG